MRWKKHLDETLVSLVAPNANGSKLNTPLRTVVDEYLKPVNFSTPNVLWGERYYFKKAEEVLDFKRPVGSIKVKDFKQLVSFNVGGTLRCFGKAIKFHFNGAVPAAEKPIQKNNTGASETLKIREGSIDMLATLLDNDGLTGRFAELKIAIKHALVDCQKNALHVIEANKLLIENKKERMSLMSSINKMFDDQKSGWHMCWSALQKAFFIAQKDEIKKFKLRGAK